MRRKKVLTGVLCYAALLLMPVGAGAQQYTPQVQIQIDGEYRYIRSNGIPNHQPGAFPNRNNPNTIAPQQHAYRVPARPRVAEQTTALGLWPFGVGVNGVPFDPGAAEFWNRDFNSGWQYEAKDGQINLGLDGSNAHVQPGGAYHYHGVPTGLINTLRGQARMVLIGYAADGFPIYGPIGLNDEADPNSGVRAMRPSWRMKDGTRPSGPLGPYDGTFTADYDYVAGSGDLDECNGRFGVTPEYPGGIYHYYITETFPFIPRQFRGTPDMSFMRHGPPPGGRGGPGGRRDPGGAGHPGGSPPPGGGRPPHPPPPPPLR